MNDLARPSALRPARYESAGAATEEDAFCALDPVAADLHKYHQDALKHCRDLAKLYGEDDPMAEVAADLADSAASALQTRLIELRADEKLCRDAKRLRIRMNRREERERERQSALFRARLQLFYMQQIECRNARDAQERRDVSLVLFLFWLLMIALQRAQERLRLARDFTLACVPEKRATAATG